METDWGKIYLVGIVVALVGLIALAIHQDNVDRAEWQKFSTDHKCKKVGHIASSSQSGFGVGSDGKTAYITTTTPSKDGFACDDGVTYWR